MSGGSQEGEEMKENMLFEEDQKKIENAVEYYNMGSYEIGEIARLSALIGKTSNWLSVIENGAKEAERLSEEIQKHVNSMRRKKRDAAE